MTSRYFHIDILRAAAIINIIVVHTLAFNLTSSQNAFLWNYLHIIDVVAFVFCSGYVVAKRLATFSTFTHWIDWFKKRIVRLLLPFYIYLAIHLSLMVLFPALFSGLELKLNGEYLLQTVTLVGGLDRSWIPLLFLELSFTFPFLLLARRIEWLHYLYLAIMGVVLVWFTVDPFPTQYYRFIMWLPWSLVIYISLWFYEVETTKGISLKRYTLGAALSLILFTILSFLFPIFGKSLVITHHKYPPNLYYFSYAFFGTFIILLISKAKVFVVEPVKQIIMLLSVESYALFFIHYIILDLLQQLEKQNSFIAHVWVQAFIALVGSLIIAYGLQVFKKRKLV